LPYVVPPKIGNSVRDYSIVFEKCKKYFKK